MDTELDRVAEVRAQTPALATRTYLDSAATGLPPLAVTEPMKEMIEKSSREGEDYPSWLADVVEFRARNAALFGVRPNEIGVVANASAGLAALAESISFEKRRKVVTSGLNFPSNVVLWHRMKETGLIDEVELVEPEGGIMPFGRWEEAVDDDTAVVAVDYVSWVNGYREDVRAVSELAHRKGAMVVVDAYHGAGVFPIDLKQDGVDAAVWGMSKWLCGPHGGRLPLPERGAAGEAGAEVHGVAWGGRQHDGEGGEEGGTRSQGRWGWDKAGPPGARPGTSGGPTPRY